MADPRLTPLPWYRPLWLCLLGIFAPDRLTAEQESDNAARNQFTDKAPREPPARIIRRAFWASLTLVLASAAFGYSVGIVASAIGWCGGTGLIVLLQVSGAALLLWGTLFVRGWDIQTYSGATLVERVNRWLYRTMYCVGTALLILSLRLPPCVG